MPVFSGLIFDISIPRTRVFNINLGMQMFQGGFFLGPFLGGFLVVHCGMSFLFYMCAAFSVISAGLIFTADRKNRSKA
jgi:predicted MFS family arabinose efflux permease